jgi:alpha-glucosidase
MMDQEQIQEKEQTVLQPVPETQTPLIAQFADVDLSKRYDDVVYSVYPDSVQTVEWYGGAYVFKCDNKVCLRIFVIENGLIRLCYHPTGQFSDDQSYAISPTFVAEKPFATLSENEREFIISTPLLQVVVQRFDLKVKFYDANDLVVCEDEAGYSATLSVQSGWSKVSTSLKMPKKASIFGLGDKTSPGNLRGKSFENWCTDSYAYGEDTDPLYKAIPFFYVLNGSQSFGVFFDNSYRTSFDFGRTKKDVLSIAADGGELNYYFLSGPSPKDIANRYHRLTGTHDLPPIWALGYHQCRWSYFSDKRVMEVAEQFRSLQIPCDAIYLDIDYMDAFKVFTWNKTTFPDAKQMIADLNQIQFKTVVMIDPGVKAEPGYWVYDEGITNDCFVKNAEGEVVLAPVWPGFCVFPDYTNPKVRTWFGALYEDLYEELGVAGFWNDMNEPAVFYIKSKTLADQAMHDFEGKKASHRKMHNVYGMQMSRSSYDGFKSIKPTTRPFLLTRANYAGGQRFSAVWTGDNIATWEHLQLANVQAVRLSISGFSFAGSDIGGFMGEPEPELYLRWLQLAVFHTLMRVHSSGQHASGDNLLETTKAITDREPWAFGEKWTILTKKAIELRYCLLGVIYTAFYQLKHEGIPILRPLAFEDCDQTKLIENDRDFIFGQHLVVSPIIASKVQRQMVHLPAGNSWYHFWTGQLIVGGSDFFVNVQLDEIPFFVREGAVLPIYPIRQSTSESVNELTLYAYYKVGSEASFLYEDDGEAYDNDEKDWSTRTEIFAEGDKDRFTVKVQRSGARPVSYSKITLIAVGLPFYVRKCLVDGVEQPIREMRVREKSIYSVQVSPDFASISWSADQVS